MAEPADHIARIVRDLPENADVAREVAALIGARSDQRGNVRLTLQDALELVQWLVRMDVKIARLEATAGLDPLPRPQ